MSLTSYIQIPAGLEDLYYAALQPGDRFTFPRIRPKTALLSQQKIKGITARSYMAQLSAAWAGFSAPTKAAWKAADQHTHKNGWRCYVGDKSKRIKYGIAGDATPTILHNDMVGELSISAPAEEIKLIQPHPQSYWIQHKVTGKKGMYEPVLVTEGFGLPLSISVSYKSDLVSTGAGSFAKMFARIRHLYQGQNLDHDLELNFSLSHDWETKTASVALLIGQPVSYNLYLHLYRVRGTLLFDNVKAEHNGSNWARDPFCSDIDKSFTKAWVQVPAHWAAVTVPDGAGLVSIYPT